MKLYTKDAGGRRYRLAAHSEIIFAAAEILGEGRRHGHLKILAAQLHGIAVMHESNEQTEAYTEVARRVEAEHSPSPDEASPPRKE